MPKISIVIDAKDDASTAIEKISKSMKEASRSGKQLDESLDKTSKSQDKAKKSADGLSRSFKGMLPALGLAGGVSAMFMIGRNATQAWEKQQAAVANMEAGLKATGHQAGLTSNQLQKMASNLQSTGIFGDEDILQNLTTQLLTFGNISGDVFDRAQRASLDVTAKLKGVNASAGDIQSTAIMMGKALDDPIKGLSAMSRVGISFSAEQRKMVEELVSANDTFGAQSVILEAIEQQYGGTNEALAKTTAGMERAAQNKLGDAMEKLGRNLQPVKIGLIDVTTALADMANAFFESEDEGIARQMDYLVKKTEELVEHEKKYGKEVMNRSGFKDDIRHMERMRGIQIDINASAKERLEIYKQIANSAEELNKKEVLYSGTSTLEMMRRQRAGIGDAPKPKKSGPTDEQVKEWQLRVKTANAYFDNLVERSQDAQRTEAERIEATKVKEIEALKEQSRYLKKEQVERAQATIEADADRSYRKLKIKQTQEMYSELSNMHIEFFTQSTYAEVEAVGQMSQSVTDSLVKMSGEMSKVFLDIEKDAKKTGLSVGDAFKLGASMATAALSSLSAILTMQNSLVQAGYNRQLEALREMHEEESRILNESYERLKENQESKDELRLAELAMYEEALQGKVDSEIRYALDKKRRDLEQADADKELAKKKAEEQKKIDQDYAMAKYKIEVESFKAQQKYEKSMVKVQTAIGIVNAWASAMRLPYPMNVAIGGTLTALMLGTAKKQTSLIDSQEPPSPPKFAGGVTNFEGGWAMVGEKGPELVTLPRGSNVITNENTEKLMGGGAPVYVVNEIYLDSALITRNIVEARRSASYGGY